MERKLSCNEINEYSWFNECFQQMCVFELDEEQSDEEQSDENEDPEFYTENWAWVDDRLEEICNPRNHHMPILAPSEWTDCSYSKLMCIEELVQGRPEDNTSDYKKCINNVINKKEI